MNQQSGMGYSYRPITAGSWELAQVWEDDGDREMEANVRLVYASPDLLAACQAVANDCERVLDGDDFSGMSDAELFRAFLNVLRPAISKATGGDAWDASMDGPTSE
jgi:hypothetical protein